MAYDCGKKKEGIFDPRIELGTFCVLSRRDNRLHQPNFLVPDSASLSLCLLAFLRVPLNIERMEETQSRWIAKGNEDLVFEGDVCHIEGGVAQMVERLLCMQEAQGSIPCSSTRFEFLLSESFAPPHMGRPYGSLVWEVKSKQLCRSLRKCKKERGKEGIEPPTSCTQSRNHTTRPFTRVAHFYLPPISMHCGRISSAGRKGSPNSVLHSNDKEVVSFV
jgi:hypothetical protein